MSTICEQNYPIKVESIEEFAASVLETDECRIGVDYEIGAQVASGKYCGLRLISPFDTMKTTYIYFFRKGLPIGRILKKVMSTISVSDHVDRITKKYLRESKNGSCPVAVSSSNAPQSLSLKQLCD